MDILFINPGCDSSLSAGELQDFYKPIPPISLAYLAAYLEQQNISVKIYDDALQTSNNQKLLKFFASIPQPLVIGLPTFSANIMYRVEEIIQIAKTRFPQALIILGNTHANIFKKELFANKLVDFIALGEAEETLLELILALKKQQKNFSKIKGLVFRNAQNKIIENPKRKLLNNLDTLPFPAWHLLSLNKYKYFFLGKVKKPVLLISGSRGCPYHCSFCSSAVVQGQLRRTRSPKNIADEMEYFQKKYRIKQFYFIDALFPLNPQEGRRFCQELIRRNLARKFIWVTETRIDAVNEELLCLMAKAGCRRIFFGLESFSQKNLDQMKKGLAISKAKKIIALCKKYKIESLGFFIIGMPGETKQDIQKTIDFARSSQLDFARFSVFTPYPGSKAYEQLKKTGQLNNKCVENWNCYTVYPTATTPSVYLNNNLTISELVFYQKLAHLKFYLKAPRIIKILKYLDFRDFLSLVSFFIRQIIIKVFVKKALATHE